ncbi:hypothetical protein Cabys_2845 [Caldithrix abyssi DSM 13497]|uniref:Uncharacterized protein n=1 Tax=Caldithrix abyssi DSM 13497 TaxID=880073 RepID=A0A1J1CBF5_CALAY|nr:hypothetical protein Cabys_2845 [Caldithrix abyssi DSM 13497]
MLYSSEFGLNLKADQVARTEILKIKNAQIRPAPAALWMEPLTLTKAATKINRNARKVFSRRLQSSQKMNKQIILSNHREQRMLKIKLPGEVERSELFPTVIDISRLSINS